MTDLRIIFMEKFAACRASDLQKLKCLFNFTIFVLLVAFGTPASASAARAPTAQAHPSASPAELIKGLQSQDPAQHERAIKAAAATEPLPLAVVPVLLNCLREGDFELGYSGEEVQALTNAGTPALPQLTLALNDPDEYVRKSALDALVSIARKSPTTWPVLISAMGNSYDDVRNGIAQQIIDIRAPLAPLLRRSLGDPNQRIRGGAAIALANMISWPWTHAAPSESLPALTTALKSIDPDARVRTVEALTRMGPAAKAAIPGVLPMLQDSDPKERLVALNFLAAMGPAANVVLPNLLEILDVPAAETSSYDLTIHMKAMDVVGGCGPAAKAAIPDLASALKSPNSEIAKHAAMALANIDPRYPGILPVLMPMLNECCETVSAINAIGEMGSNAQQVVPALERLLAIDGQASNRQAAVTALARIEGLKAIPTLERALSSDQDDSVRIAAATALAEVGSSDSHALSALMEAISSDSEAVREAASAALAKLGETAIPVLIAGLKSSDLYQRAWAVETLSRIKPLPDDAVRELKITLGDKSAIIQNEAADAIKGVTVDANAEIQDEASTDGDSDVASADEDENVPFNVDQGPQNIKRYSMTEIVAAIPADDNHEYPSVLKYSVPDIPTHSDIARARYLITVYGQKDGEDRLAVWEKIAANQYRAVIAPTAAGPDASFDKPIVFSAQVLVTGQGKARYESALFFDLPLRRYWRDGEGVDDYVFVIDSTSLMPVQIQEGDYPIKLEPGEWTWNSLGNSFADNDLEFGFHIWEKDECHACPGGADVSGTYKVIKQMHYDAKIKDWVPSWKMVVDTAKRTPTPDSW